MNTNAEVLDSRILLSQDEKGRLVYVDEHEQKHVDVVAVRAFPITDTMHGISILTKEGKELTWIDNIETVANPARSLLEEALDQKQFMPIISKVLSISRTAEPNEWEVETNRGLTRFPLRSEEDVLRLTGQRALIIDANGVRYLITDLTTLDTRSRRLLERYL